jgi:hypothetical protein
VKNNTCTNSEFARKRPGKERSKKELERLSDFLNFAGADAGCANANSAASPVYQRANRLQIDVPAPLGHVVGVADPIAELRAPSADLTNSCHKNKTLPIVED